MADVKVTKDKAEKCNKETFKLSDYIKQNFGMFTGETVKAKIAFDESLVSVVLDRFGSDTHLIKHGENMFAIKVNVSATPVFLGWIFSFGNQAEILEPESLRDAMGVMIKTCNSMYGCKK